MASQLRELRKAQGISPTQLAAQVGVSEQTLMRWERAHNLNDLTYSKLISLAKALNTEVKNFISE